MPCLGERKAVVAFGEESVSYGEQSKCRNFTHSIYNKQERTTGAHIHIIDEEENVMLKSV